jgi:hypothetical protein
MNTDGSYNMIDVDNTQPTDYHHDQEPDMKSYMKTEQYAKEFDKAFGDVFGDPIGQIDDIIKGLGVNHEH